MQLLILIVSSLQVAMVKGKPSDRYTKSNEFYTSHPLIGRGIKAFLSIGFKNKILLTDLEPGRALGYQSYFWRYS